MATLSFDQNGTGCSLPPFNAVSNRLYFFRVNVFEMDLPLDMTNPDDGDAGTPAFPGFPTARLGLPITDLFPHLLPEYEPSLPAIGRNRPKVRLRQGVFLPASTLNKTYAAAKLVAPSAAEIDGKHITVDGERIPLSQDKLDRLTAGQPASIIVGNKLVRVMPPAQPFPEAEPGQSRTSSLRPDQPAVPGAPFSRVKDLSDSQFEALCFALFVDSDAPGFEWLDVLGAKDGAKLKASCKSDPRFAAFDKKRKGKRKLDPPRYEIGFISEYEQVWDLVGYSRGGLVSSLTLTPEEELTIEVFTWDRSKLEEERDQTTETERSVETTSMARVSSQLNSDLTETTDKNASLGLGAPLPIGPVNINASGQAGVSDSIAQNISSTVETISETTRRASERFKTTTQVKVVQTRETGSETRVTRRIRNPNRGRTLTLHCFEVIEHYKITTRLLRANKFALLAEIPQPKSFGIHFILAHEEKLQKALLGSSYLPGFEAAKKLLAQTFFDHRSAIKAEIEAAQAKARGDDAPPAEPVIVSLAKDMRKRLARFLKLDVVKEVGRLANAYLPGNSICHKDRAEAEEALGIFNFWLKFKTVTPGVDSRAQDFLQMVPASGTLTPQEAYEALSVITTGLDDEWLTTIKMIAASLVAAQLGFTLLVPFPWLAPVLLEFAVIENNLGLPALMDRAKQAVRAYEVTLKQPPPPSDSNNDKGQKQMPPPQLFTLQELSLADAEFKKLVLHLEANRVYYMNSIFAQEDANVRYEKLRALGIHNFVENRLLGFLGSRVVLPLRVENLEEEARTFLNGQLTNKLSTLLPNIAPVAEDVSMPTSGLHMEPVIGECEALEPFLRDSRAIELATAQAQLALLQARNAQLATESDRRLPRN
jgi:hypothetical protein